MFRSKAVLICAALLIFCAIAPLAARAGWALGGSFASEDVASVRGDLYKEVLLKQYQTQTPVRPLPAAQAVDDGFVRVREANWSLAGDPPRLVVCLKKEQTGQGVFVNASKCTKFGTPQQYLDARFPGKRVVLTRFDYSCSAESKTAYNVHCPPEVVLYYRISP